MNNPVADIIQKARSFLFSNLNKQLLVFLFFLALSSIFWLLQTLNESYDKEVTIGLKITDVPQNVVITTDLPDTVRITLHDKGYALLAYATRLERPLCFSFKQYANTTTGKGSIPMADVQKLFTKDMLSSTQVVSVKPDKFVFAFNYGESKKVPIRMQGNFIPADNYYLAQTSFTPESVRVYGNRHQLDTLHYVMTEFFEAKNFEDTLSKTVHLQAIRGMKIVPGQVRVTLRADILTEESMEVPITAVNTPEGKNIRFFPNKVKVTFQVGASKVRLIKPSQFLVVADYNEIAKQPAEKCNIRLRTMPNTVTKPQLELHQVDYILEQK